MAKIKTVYVCSSCGTTEPKWVGLCSSCGEWNSFIEEVEAAKNKKSGVNSLPSVGGSSSRPYRLSEIETSSGERLDMVYEEFNRVLGGGLVPGSLVLLGGDPGIGKSTLVLQVALSLKGKKILYVSGEESLQQLKMRSERVGEELSEALFLSETDLYPIIKHVESVMPDLLIIDSIQTLTISNVESSPGSIVQLRECTAALQKCIKRLNIPTILIGHINKEGSIAGPKVLEHIVDTVLQFEGDRNHLYRILRSIKNRFGSTAELGIFAMENRGLREVVNPSELLLSRSGDAMSGTSVAATVEGMRSFMIEVQALVSSAAYGTPQRTSTGFDTRRLNMLLAVLEKRAGFRLMTKDVFINIAGGIKVDDPAMDLSVIASILSSSFDSEIDKDIAFCGEVGLTGEIRAVTRVETRISEAAKLGFKQIILSKYNRISEPERFDIEIVKVDKVGDLVRKLFR